MAPAAAAAAPPEPVVLEAPTALKPPALAVPPLEPLLVPDPLVDVAAALARDIPTTELEALTESIRQSGQIPREFDSRLLGAVGRALGARLDPAQKKEVRQAFLKACEDRLVETQKAAEAPAPERKG